MVATSVLAQEASSSSAVIIQFAILLLIPIALYSLIVRPQRRRTAVRRNRETSMAVGDEVITDAGLYGVVSGHDGDKLWLEIANDVQIRVARSSVRAWVDDNGDEAGEEVDVMGKRPTKDSTGINGASSGLVADPPASKHSVPPSPVSPSQGSNVDQSHEEIARFTGRLSEIGEMVRELESARVVSDDVPEWQLVVALVNDAEKKLDELYFDQSAIRRWNGNPLTKVMPEKFMALALSGASSPLYWFAKADSKCTPLIFAEVTRKAEGYFRLKYTSMPALEDFPFRNC
jgi:preprotein translocase subunit YajC